MDHPKTSRRRFLATLTAAPAMLAAAPSLLSAADKPTTAPAGAATPDGPFSLAPLPYAPDALEPHIDALTMTIHHGKHHAAYVANLNKAVAGKPDLAGKTLDDLLRNLDKVADEATRTAIRNNGGGHYNHTMFWDLMTPGGAKQPKGDLADAIKSAFGDFSTFQQQFEEAGLKRFGSGWVWLVADDSGKLEIVSSANQDNPIMEGKRPPILGNDVWEHAYYLKYQNRRGDYLKAWWNVVNWDKAAERFAAQLKS
ncbi:MAG: superoxide dismutase [Candidatus Sumerlaeaceae bacterium]|nr:superoxide dismutase [Candidatus Sumerlaeaceae bacterium]